MSKLKPPTTIGDWIEGRKRASAFYGYTPSGDLTMKDTGVSLQPQRYMPAKPEVTVTAFQTRDEALKSLQEELTAAKQELREVYKSHKGDEANTPSNKVIEANYKVNVLQCKISEILKGAKHQVEIEKLQHSDLSFDRYRKANILDTVTSMQTSRYDWRAFWSVAPPAAQAANPLNAEDDIVEEERQHGGAKKTYTAQQRAIIANIKRRKAGAF